MDYNKIYNNLIERAKNRILPDDVYVERHHILPKCIGGDNKISNLVKLRPKEHYLAHLLLHTMFPDNQGLTYSFWMMCNGNKKDKRTYRISGKTYESIRNKFISMVKEREPFFKGKRHTEESKQKNRESHLGKITWSGKTHTEESKKKMSDIRIGLKLSDDTRKKISLSKKGVKFSDEHKKKLSDSSKGNNNKYKRYLERTGLPHAKSKPISQFSLNGELIKEWINGSIASKESGVGYKGINNNLRGKTKTSGGFIWEFKK